MIKSVILGSLLVLLSGCAAGEGWMTRRGDVVYILVKTDPDGASITFPDGSSCETPCRVGVVVPLEATIGRAGYKAVKTTLTRTSPSPYTVRLEAVGRSQSVEEVALPEL